MEEDEEIKENELEIHNVEKNAASKKTCEISPKAKVRKLKEVIAIELGLAEEDANNIKLFVNGEEIIDDKINIKDIGITDPNL